MGVNSIIDQQIFQKSLAKNKLPGAFIRANTVCCFKPTRLTKRSSMKIENIIKYKEK
jgi:hypothetical protein